MRFLKMTVFACCLVVVVSCNRSLQQDTTRGASSADKNQLTVLSYNIHHANPPSKPDFIDLPAIARVIKESGADVVALQEVDRDCRRTDYRDVARDLAHALDMNWVGAGEFQEIGEARDDRQPARSCRHRPRP